jgi:DNA-binding transcriptional regulator/RsmH inhibitor MraZ
VTLIGSGDHFEVWDDQKWQKYEQEKGAHYEDLAEHLSKK